MLRGGRWGYDRLRILARVRRAETLELLGRAGVSPGQRCVDLGSGGGEVSFELAREAAAERGVANVEFRAANVNDWAQPGAYDLVYCRFLLQHLSRPGDLLRRMWEAVREPSSSSDNRD